MTPEVSADTTAAPARSSLLQRCTVGGLVLLLLAGVFHLDWGRSVPWISLVLVNLFGLVGAIEYHRLWRGSGVACRLWLGVAFALLLLGGKSVVLAAGRDAPLLVETLLCAYVITLFVVEVLVGRAAEGVARIMVNLLGFAYLILFSFLLDLLLRPAAPLGLQVALLVVLVAKGTDIGGYLVGSLVGGPKLVPKVSPGKTWSGLGGGLALSVTTAVIGGGLLDAGVAAPFWALFGLVVGAASLFGDLAESLLKRACGTKDASALVPTFGGVLDMVDSLVLSAPIGYWLLVWLAGLPA